MEHLFGHLTAFGRQACRNPKLIQGSGRQFLRSPDDKRGAAEQLDLFRIDSRSHREIGRVEDEQRPIEDQILEPDRAVIGHHQVCGGKERTGVGLSLIHI